LQLTTSTNYLNIINYLICVEIPHRFDAEFAQDAINKINAATIDSIPKAYDPKYFLVGIDATTFEDLVMPATGYEIRVTNANEIIETVKQAIYNTKIIPKLPSDPELTPGEAG